MSSFKQLNKADITTVPYAANKRWSFYFTSSPSDGITFYRGTKSTFDPINDNPAANNGQYRSLTYDLINHMYYQTYSGSLDTGSLMFNTNTYESASQQRPTSSYFIYNSNPQLIKNFPLTGSISVMSISPKIFGSKILPHSFAMSASTVLIVDDGYGNLFDIDQATDDYVALSYVSSSYFADPTPDQGIIFVGNIFYAQGLVVITNQNTNYLDLLDPASTPPVQMSFQNEHIIYENEVRCIVRESDFNLSYNPTLITGSYANGILRDFATASFFQPYTTTIGLYNDNNDLLMVAKLGKPIALSSDTDMTFIVRYDT